MEEMENFSKLIPAQWEIVNEKDCHFCQILRKETAEELIYEVIEFSKIDF